MTITTNENGQQNLFAKEPEMYVSGTETYAERAELWNSRTAMIGVVAGLLSYALTGNLFFGIY